MTIGWMASILQKEVIFTKTHKYTYRPTKYIIQIYSGITGARVLDGELLYPKILEVNLFAFAYSLVHEDFSPIYRALGTLGALKHVQNIQHSKYTSLSLLNGVQGWFVNVT